MTKLLVIGAGRMAEAIISGLVNAENSRFTKITAANNNDELKLEKLTEKYGINSTHDAMAEVEGHDAVLLASPPASNDALLRELAEKLTGQLVITVAAGIDPDYMEARLPADTPAVWIMPNTGAQIGQSMSTFACGNFVEDTHRNVVYEIVQAIGVAEELPQQKVHDLTAVTGSAPAFLYAFAEALEEAAMMYDVPREQARKLVTNMLKGSVAMLEENGDPEALMDQVASPGGSTAEGLKVLNENGLQELVKKAVKAANDHARSNN